MRNLSSEVVEAAQRYRSAWERSPLLRAKLAGQVYPTEVEGILAMVESHFQEGLGHPPQLRPDESQPDVLGVVVPHLDFRVAGGMYAPPYQRMLTAPPRDCYIILGVGHRCPAPCSLLAKGYKTPLGEIGCETPLVDAICERLSFDAKVHPTSHDGEHSIEFVAIYLQALARMREQEPPKIVPILCGGMDEEIAAGRGADSPMGCLGLALRNVMAGWPSRIGLIISVDGSHVGPRFGHSFSVDSDCLEKIRIEDMHCLEAVSSGDPDRFLQTFTPTANGRYFDGVGALYAAMVALRGRARFQLLDDDQWFEESDQSVVTIACGVFEQMQEGDTL